MPDKSQLTVKLEDKVHWLAAIRACELNITLADLVEQLIRQGISRDAVLADEPKVGEPKPPALLWNESLWDKNPAIRLYNLAKLHPDWLSRSETKLWINYCAQQANVKKPHSAKSFREFFEQNTVKGE